ncbi:glucosamine-6-phosphate deaminase [Paenibacillus antibioticophila]|uniref:Glucosamine-6-phosphate deaminase n=1 Tax=Paenibacillus antibioticophila TaxID=1274374 RepID=A0A919XT69_9BACL|nr:glucosamine-6-phosphate deaminase [Paenibacillus antibioticophila]GIO38811.1 glucosamine-6-phosphate deaminase [Paenibacillus antibioticophila]
MINIIKVNSEQQFNETGAGIIASLLQSNPRAILGLATGGTPVGVYQKLVELYREGVVSFKQASSYNLDEYVGLPENHPESYRRFMNEKLFDHIDIPIENTHVPSGNSEKAAEEYTRLLEKAGQIDLQLLGVGHNGHIGFNEPNENLHGPTHIVELDELTRQANARYFSSIEEVPTHAVTMGIGTILQAKQILLMAKGADKAEIVAKALKGPITTQCPASLLQTHANVVVVLDQAAGGLL